MKYIKSIVFGGLIILLMTSFISPVLAQEGSEGAAEEAPPATEEAADPGDEDSETEAGAGGNLVDPAAQCSFSEGDGEGIWAGVPLACQQCGICNLCHLVQIAINIGRIILGVVGAIALIFFIYGGFVLILSGGRPDEVKKGQKILINTIIGLLIVLIAYLVITTIVAFVTGGWDWQAKINC